MVYVINRENFKCYGRIRLLRQLDFLFNFPKGTTGNAGVFGIFRILLFDRKGRVDVVFGICECAGQLLWLPIAMDSGR